MSDLAETLARKSAGKTKKPAANNPTGRTTEKMPTGEDAPRWEDTHRRASFYLPIDLIEALDDAAAGGDLSKSQIVVQALTDRLEL